MSRLKIVNLIVTLAAAVAVGVAIWFGLDVKDFMDETARPRYAGWIMMLLGGYMFLPVPSSFLMTTNGRWFGPALGLAISFSSSMLAWISWYWLGRSLGWGVLEPLLAKVRRSSAAEPNVTAGTWLNERFGHLGIVLLIVSRPVPLLAGLVAGAAGAVRMTWWRFLLGAALGVLPMATLYVLVGWRFGGLGNPVALAVAVGVPALLYVLVARPFGPRKKPEPSVECPARFANKEE